MINSLSIKDEEIFLRLGTLLHSNFSNLYDLKSILNSSIHYLYGYYINNELVGFIHFIKSYETLDLLDLVVDERFRNQGVASSLLEYSFLQISNINRILLEVKESNKEAYNLYKKFGFNEIYIRKKYYGSENAIVMEKVF